MLEFARPSLRQGPREEPVPQHPGDFAFEPFGLFCRQLLGMPCGHTRDLHEKRVVLSSEMAVRTFWPVAIIFSVCPVGIRETSAPDASARDLSGVTL